MRVVLLIAASLGVLVLHSPWQGTIAPPSASVPRTWDEQAMSSLELPLAFADATPAHIPAAYIYRIPIRRIYRSYPVYHPQHEPKPAGQPYLTWLATQRPQEILADFSQARTDSDWQRIGPALGKEVFEAPIADDTDPLLGVVRLQDIRDPVWYERIGVPVTSDGVVPFMRYVVTDQGVRLGQLACAMCHTRVMKGNAGDTIVAQGAQGNFPFDRAIGYRLRADAVTSPKETLEGERAGMRLLFGTPWLTPDPLQPALDLPLDGLIAAYEAIPAGVLARHGASVLSPVQIPDLTGVRERRYLDRTGLVRHREPGDLMRYAALNQGGDLLNRYGSFIPAGTGATTLPDPEQVLPRYSDEQLYALAVFLYALEPPVNPHARRGPAEEERVALGARVFDREGCAGCHKPPAYTNNKLTRAPGVALSEDHPEWPNVLTRRVGTDPFLTTRTRRGTGLYKVPSLKGVWYRGPFEHNGSVATLEDWFDPRRVEDGYVPTGWKGPPGVTRRAVKGHEFGLDVTDEERAALIAFLRTL